MSADRADDGAAQRLVEALITGTHGDDCIMWPFACHGWPEVYDNELGRPQRVGTKLCEALRGPKPFPAAIAVSTCGKGCLHGCVNPKHFYWGTRADTMRIRAENGVGNQGEANGRAILTDQEALAIRSLCGRYYDQELADQFGVGRSTVARIRKGTHWRHLWASSSAPVRGRGTRWHRPAPTGS